MRQLGRFVLTSFDWKQQQVDWATKFWLIVSDLGPFYYTIFCLKIILVIYLSQINIEQHRGLTVAGITLLRRH